MNEERAGGGCNYPGKRGFSASGRPPQNHGKNTILLNGSADNAARSHCMTLAHKLIQIPGPHALRQRSGGVRCFLCVEIEYVHNFGYWLSVIGYWWLHQPDFICLCAGSGIKLNIIPPEKC